MLGVRQFAKNTLIWTLSQISRKVELPQSQNKTGPGKMPRLHRFTIMSGPLHGMNITMPKVEQVAFILGNYEPKVAATMAQYIRPGMAVYDIGANIGYFSMLFSKWVGADGHVFSFEPDPTNSVVLHHNIAINHLKNVSIWTEAVSDENSQVQFATFGYSLVSHIVHDSTPEDADILSINAVTLDTFVYERKNPVPHFLKIDVEGAEEQVLHGATRVLEYARPALIVEMRCDTEARIRAIAKSLKYSLQPISGDAQWIAKYGYDEFLMIPEKE